MKIITLLLIAFTLTACATRVDYETRRSPTIPVTTPVTDPGIPEFIRTFNNNF